MTRKKPFEVTFDGKTLRVNPKLPAEVSQRGLRFKIISGPAVLWQIKTRERSIYVISVPTSPWQIKAK